MPTPALEIDEGLRQFATRRQREFMDVVTLHGSASAAERALGVSAGLIARSIRSLKKVAATKGYSPDHDMRRVVPDPFIVKGVSTYYDSDGKARGQWVKSAVDRDKVAEMRDAALNALGDELRGLSPVTASPATVYSDILAVYPMGDPHFGMHSWGRETGEDFDLDEAERLTAAAIDRLVTAAPAAETAIILSLGDYFHMDDQSNRTPASGHQLDVDNRFPKVLEAGIRAMRHAILRALEKHRRVIVRMEPGNHDPHANWALVVAMAGYFENEPRVEIVRQPGKFWFYRFGKVLLGSTHGDTVKQEAMLGVMATDAAVDWGLSKFRYFYSGHVHHQAVKELAGVTCESFRTLAAKDAYASSHGYRAGRDMRLIVHHREFGEIERHRCDVAMIGVAAA